VPDMGGIDYFERTQPTQGSSHKLYKSNSNKMVDGVCGGIAEYFRVDASAVRLILVAFTVLSIGTAVVFYVACMMIIPMEPSTLDPTVEDGTKVSSHAKMGSASGATTTLIIGVIVIIVGVTLLFDYYDILSVTSMWHSTGRLALPIIFILIGGTLLLGRGHDDMFPSTEEQGSEGNYYEVAPSIGNRKLLRSNSDRKILGVCGGIAKYFNLDSTVVRVVFVLLVFASFGFALLIYLACDLIIPREEVAYQRRNDS